MQVNNLNSKSYLVDGSKSGSSWVKPVWGSTSLATISYLVPFDEGLRKEAGGRWLVASYLAGDGFSIRRAVWRDLWHGHSRMPGKALVREDEGRDNGDLAGEQSGSARWGRGGWDRWGGVLWWEREMREGKRLAFVSAGSGWRDRAMVAAGRGKRRGSAMLHVWKKEGGGC